MRRNLELIRGQTLTFSGVLRDAAGAAIDLTDATVTWRLGSSDGRYTRLTLTESDGITVTAGTGGAWSITIDPADTTGIAPGPYAHQGEAVIGSATHDLVNGRVILRRDFP